MVGRPQKYEAPSFGRRLSALRKAKHLTQPELAKHLDISVKAVDYYERRAKNPSVEFVRKVADVLLVSIEELIGEGKVKSKRKPGPVPQFSKQLEQIQKLSRPKQQHILSVVDAFIAQNTNGH
jgi:transcriptional regulator with XRE-family HTH domain